MELISIPETPAATSNRRWMIWLLPPLVAGLVMGSYWLLTRLTAANAGATTAASGMYYAVKPMNLEIKLTKDGELQAVKNIDIICRVEGGSTVQTLVPEGTWAKKGDVLITLDSSTIKQKIEDTTLDLQKAEADLVTAKEMREIQLSQNATNLDAAEVALTLAKLDLQGYESGAYPQQVSKANSDLELARLTLKNAEENLAQTRALFAKNFVTATDIKKAEQDVVKARADVTAAENAQEVLTKYTHESDEASKKNALSQAEQKYVRTQRENAANLAQKTADVQAKTQALDVLKRRMERWQEQLAACTITAPADGLVVYVTSGDRNAQNALQEGTQVRERQALLRLPDTSSMKAVARIGEAQVWRLREGMRAKVSLTNGAPMDASLTAISVLSDNSQRWWNDAKEYPVDLTLEHTPPSLKPGMGVKCEVLIDRADNVLAVPLPAIFTAGPKSYVFVRGGGGEDDSPRPVEVKIGRINDQYAEVREGLTNGQQVKILQIGEGQELLARAGIKTSIDQPDGSFGDGKGTGVRGPGGRGGRRGGNGPGGPGRNGDGGSRRGGESQSTPDSGAQTNGKPSDNAVPAPAETQTPAPTPAPTPTPAPAK